MATAELSPDRHAIECAECADWSACRKLYARLDVELVTCGEDDQVFFTPEMPDPCHAPDGVWAVQWRAQELREKVSASGRELVVMAGGDYVLYGVRLRADGTTRRCRGVRRKPTLLVAAGADHRGVFHFAGRKPLEFGPGDLIELPIRSVPGRLESFTLAEPGVAVWRSRGDDGGTLYYGQRFEVLNNASAADPKFAVQMMTAALLLSEAAEEDDELWTQAEAAGLAAGLAAAAVLPRGAPELARGFAQAARAAAAAAPWEDARQSLEELKGALAERQRLAKAAAAERRRKRWEGYP